jgi:hypothetical protein
MFSVPFCDLFFLDFCDIYIFVVCVCRCKCVYVFK